MHGRTRPGTGNLDIPADMHLGLASQSAVRRHTDRAARRDGNDNIVFDIDLRRVIRPLRVGHNTRRKIAEDGIRLDRGFVLI